MRNVIDLRGLGEAIERLKQENDNYQSSYPSSSHRVALLSDDDLYWLLTARCANLSSIHVASS